MPNEPGETTSASSWRGSRKGGDVVTLPSGNRARLRRTFSVVSAMENGSDIPNPLMRHLRTMKIPLPEGGEREIKGFDVKTIPEQDLQEIIDTIDREVVNVFVEPRVELVPPGEDANIWQPADESALSIADVAWNDRIFAYMYSQGAVSSLTSFRELQTAVESMEHGASVHNDAQSPAPAEEQVPSVVSGSGGL